MSDQSSAPDSVGILVPSGMLGAGFSPGTITRGISLGADVIAVDGGSTDSGPYYLGTGTAKTTERAVRRDLRLLLAAASSAGIPLLVGSCGTSGTDSGVNWVAGIVNAICAEDGLDLAIAKIFSEQDAGQLIAQLERGRIHPLPPSGPLDAATLRRCAHIVGMMGHEPIEQALRAGANVVLAGRATDTAVSAAFALMRGMPPGPAWHAAKIVECGGQCTTNPASGGVFARIDHGGFTIEPLDPDTACTPASVAAHMLYETVNPYTMREPGGTIEVASARYTAIDERTVRVEGSRFESASQYTVKLEGAAVTGYETVSFTGIRDPQILQSIEVWAEFFEKSLTERVESVLELARGSWEADLRLYGYNAILGELEQEPATPAEVGVMLLVSAEDQQTATAISKLANPLLLHLPLPTMSYLPSFAFATSPAHIDRGAAYEFVLNHVVDVDSPTDMFRLEMTGMREPSHA
jgi:acyclic terpene utilization AtuA family protein